MKISRIVLALFLLVHHAVAISHGNIHTEMSILLPDYKNTFIIAVMLILPIVAVVMIWTRYARWGFLLLACCMAASLLFDVYHHYILVSPDNIAHLPQGTDEQHNYFIWTANGLALLQLIGTILAGYWFTKYKISEA